MSEAAAPGGAPCFICLGVGHEPEDCPGLNIADAADLKNWRDRSRLRARIESERLLTVHDLPDGHPGAGDEDPFDPLTFGDYFAGSIDVGTPYQPGIDGPNVGRGGLRISRNPDLPEGLPDLVVTIRPNLEGFYVDDGEFDLVVYQDLWLGGPIQPGDTIGDVLAGIGSGEVRGTTRVDDHQRSDLRPEGLREHLAVRGRDVAERDRLAFAAGGLLARGAKPRRLRRVVSDGLVALARGLVRLSAVVSPS